MKKLTQREFEERAHKVHNGKYTLYGAYISNRKEIDIFCPIHGWFSQIAQYHLQGHGCSKCGINEARDKRSKSTEEFINEAMCVSKNDYIDFSNVKYINNHSKVCFICHKLDMNGFEHGMFKMTPKQFLNGHGCHKCKNERLSIVRYDTQETFEDKVINKIGNKYKILGAYEGSKIPMEVYCSKHGSFKIRPNNLLNGNGCPKCKSSHLETEIRNLLTENNIKFKEQYKSQWLGLQSLDFYLPDYKVGIECQGEQHFRSVEHFGGDKNFNKYTERDKMKFAKCQENGVRLLYYSNLGIEYPYEVFEDKNELLKWIYKYENIIV